MDFKEATDELGTAPTHQELADELGVDLQRIRQARLADGNPAQRPAPDGWESATVAVAKRHRDRLNRLIRTLSARRRSGESPT